MTAHTPRFTAKAPDAARAVARQRLDRCTSVRACDTVLAELVARLRRASMPELVDSVRAEVDTVLDRRTELALQEATAEAMRLSREEPR